jgi:hypothetical protein
MSDGKIRIAPIFFARFIRYKRHESNDQAIVALEQVMKPSG